MAEQFGPAPVSRQCLAFAGSRQHTPPCAGRFPLWRGPVDSPLLARRGDRIIADSGGGVPAEFYWDTAFQSEDDGVAHIFTLDSPINGIDHTTLASYYSSATHITPILALFYSGLWQNMDSNDQAELNADGDGSFIPIGTVGDFAYVLGDLGAVGSGNQGQDAELDTLLSQFLFQCSGGIFDTCTPQSPPDFLSPCSGEPYGLADASHELVRFCKPTVDYITGIAANDEQNAIALYDEENGIAPATSAGQAAAPLDRSSTLLTPASSQETAQVVSTDASSSQVRHVAGSGPMTQSILSAAAIGQTITIDGSGLGASPGTVAFTSSSGPGTRFGTIRSWSDSAVSVVVPSGATPGPVLLQTSGGNSLLVGSICLLTGKNSVASLTATVPPEASSGQPEQLTITAKSATGQPVVGASVALFDGSVNSSASTNSLGVATFSISGFGTQQFLAHSGNVASSLITLSWNSIPGPTFTTIAPLTPVCVSTITGSHTGALTLGKSTCLVNASISGPVTVAPGVSVEVINSSLKDGLSANGPGSILVCSSNIAGAVTINKATGFVMLGDGCGDNAIAGVVQVTASSAGIGIGSNQVSGAVSLNNNVDSGPDTENAAPKVEGNTISGVLSCYGNAPAPTTDSQPNHVSGLELGQCAGF